MHTSRFLGVKIKVKHDREGTAEICRIVTLNATDARSRGAQFHANLLEERISLQLISVKRNAKRILVILISRIFFIIIYGLSSSSLLSSSSSRSPDGQANDSSATNEALQINVFWL